MELSRHIEVCPSPALLPFYETKGKIVVVIDIFRASSAICAALAHGVQDIIPVATIEEALTYKKQGYLVAAERLGAVVEGFNFGNSPYAFMGDEIRGKTVVLTTTNCTTALHQVEGAAEIVLGAFVNLQAIAAYIQSRDEDVLLLCAGWNNRCNLEDTIFAGAVARTVQDAFSMEDDSTMTALHLYDMAKDNLRQFLWTSSHSRRLKHLNIEEDITYCLMLDKAPVVPVFDGRTITAKKIE